MLLYKYSDKKKSCNWNLYLLLFVKEVLKFCVLYVNWNVPVSFLTKSLKYDINIINSQKCLLKCTEMCVKSTEMSINV